MTHPLQIVTIMDYPREERYARMCRLFLDSVIAHGAERIRILYESNEPVVAPEHRRAIPIDVVRGHSYDVGHPHFNLRFKLANLTRIPFPFLYLDADMVVLSDLHYLWERRHAKPWIGIDHQWVPSDARTHRTPVQNSRLQLVSDPNFYNLDAILAAQNAVMPLSRHGEVPKSQMFPCPGHDQAILFRYFQSIGYDYTHPEIGPAWNSCAGVTQVARVGHTWKAHTVGLDPNYDVHLIHYWSQFKPWEIGCPLFLNAEPFECGTRNAECGTEEKT